jgi:hypothetical protein
MSDVVALRAASLRGREGREKGLSPEGRFSPEGPLTGTFKPGIEG